MSRFGLRKGSKYGANKFTFNGITFDSKYEGERYMYLMDLQREGKIGGLRLQHSFSIIGRVVKMVERQLKTKVRMEERVVEMEARYTCDFLYEEQNRIIVEEFKSHMTAQLPDYILRRKLMVNKIYKHNERPGRRQWVFREVVYHNKNKITITDK